MMVMGPLIMGTIQEGAKNQIWAATCKKEELKNGAYYKPIASFSKGSAKAQNPKLAESLWEWTEKELASKGY